MFVLPILFGADIFGGYVLAALCQFAILVRQNPQKFHLLPSAVFVERLGGKYLSVVAYIAYIQCVGIIAMQIQIFAIPYQEVDFVAVAEGFYQIVN